MSCRCVFCNKKYTYVPVPNPSLPDRFFAYIMRLSLRRAHLLWVQKTRAGRQGTIDSDSDDAYDSAWDGGDTSEDDDEVVAIAPVSKKRGAYLTHSRDKPIPKQTIFNRKKRAIEGRIRNGGSSLDGWLTAGLPRINRSEAPEPEAPLESEVTIISDEPLESWPLEAARLVRYICLHPSQTSS